MTFAQLTSTWGFCAFYILPVGLCIFGYTARTVETIRGDRYNRDFYEKAGHTYIPQIKVGTVVGYIIVSLLPGGNLIALVFDVAPRLLGEILNTLENLLNIPTVPRRTKKED